MRFFNLPFTSQCPLCLADAPMGQFCRHCQDDIASSYLSASRCPHCQLALPQHGHCENCHQHALVLSNIYAAFDYIPPMDSLVLQYKNAHQPHLARCFASLLSQQLRKNQQLPPLGTLMIPIPSSTSALQKRLFNPAVLFAKYLAKQLQCRLNLHILRRHDSHLAQKNLSRSQRFLHSSQLYYCAQRLDIPRVILIDDILTTGSTLDGAARALIAAGVQQVDAMVIARTANPLS